MKPLAMSFQLVMDEKRRLAAEIEIVFSSGDTIFRRVGANEKMTIFFEEVEKELKEENSTAPCRSGDDDNS